MNEAFENDWNALSSIQKDAARWENGSIVVLAGPGSGKTRVLTCHIAYLLEKSSKQNFRILGLTFTNKAADEMRTRVQKYVPEHERRLFLGTFHSFCADILRQHGVHIGINPIFIFILKIVICNLFLMMQCVLYKNRGKIFLITLPNRSQSLIG